MYICILVEKGGCGKKLGKGTEKRILPEGRASVNDLSRMLNRVLNN